MTSTQEKPSAGGEGEHFVERQLGQDGGDESEFHGGGAWRRFLIRSGASASQYTGSGFFEVKKWTAVIPRLGELVNPAIALLKEAARSRYPWTVRTMISRWLLSHPSRLRPVAAARRRTTRANDAQNDSTDAPHGKPLVKWTFDDAVVGTWQGKPKIEAQGPQQPVFPNFAKGNKAAFFSGKDSSLTVKESDLPDVNLRFKNGDALTIEAWVNVTDFKGSYVYLVGKGRNKKKEFATENQNYALRLKNDGGEARVCFLVPQRVGEVRRQQGLSPLGLGRGLRARAPAGIMSR